MTELFPNPDYPGEPELIKTNPVRMVWRQGDFYFKAERRKLFYSKAKKEFASLKMLTVKQIPAVEPVACYSSGAFDVLVTRSFAADAQNAAECWENGQAILPELLDFIGHIFHGGIYHPDFHMGNILYSPSRNAFALVDVYGVKPDKNLSHARKMRMERILLELREFCLFDRLEELWQRYATGCDLISALRREAAEINRDLPRRFRQIAENYPKFVACDPVSGILHSLNAGRKRFQLPSEKLALPAKEIHDIWQRHFYCQLHKLPHRRAISRGSDFIELEKTTPFPDASNDSSIENYLAAIPDVPKNFNYALNAKGFRVIA